ncbi:MULTISPECIES: hypothetical protein [unclassified Nonomuraea]|uniref:hypothetical protein n=1 Tax=unclassified Nonomuraea TaxID=2593643 RepID=UPI0033E53A7C
MEWPFFQPAGNKEKERFDALNAMSCERIRKIGEGRPGNLHALYAGLADACESALMAKADKWQGAEQNLAKYESVDPGPELTCADDQVLRILEKLVNAHRQVPDQPVKVMRLSASESLDC